MANSKNPERRQDWGPMFARELDISQIACYFGLLGEVILQIDSKISYPMDCRSYSMGGTEGASNPPYQTKIRKTNDNRR